MKRTYIQPTTNIHRLSVSRHLLSGSYTIKGVAPDVSSTKWKGGDALSRGNSLWEEDEE